MSSMNFTALVWKTGINMVEVARGYHPNVRHSSQAFKKTLGITLWNVPRSQLKIRTWLTLPRRLTS